MSPARKTATAGRGARAGAVKRKTKETNIDVSLRLDAGGKAKVSTTLPFLDHMLELIAVHGLMDLTVKARGDLEVDQHHTVEDLGLVLGRALDEALGDRRGIVRYASISLPMDEVLVNVAVDLGGRPGFAYDLKPKQRIVGSFDTTLMPHFLESFAQTGRFTLHLTEVRGGNSHHLLEAAAKGLGRVIDAASRQDPRRGAQVPSSKGRIGA
ncbi:MAG TPA: imidazoleglycerol-phosphate dehydratase HisB [Candidatus Saccharimonadales bacterium]|nr:imidazoleglycerol-phosphate dehydratase HisB [Candidatus Saccharimonadales bacterium]